MTKSPTSIPNWLISHRLTSWASKTSIHKPRILLLYGSTRERSFSRLLVEEAARLLEHFGAEARIFNPSGLPLPDDAPDDHPRVKELRELMLWSRGRFGALQNVTVP
jgi:hypothetical protein